MNSGEEISPAAPAGIGTRHLSITSPALLPHGQALRVTRVVLLRWVGRDCVYGHDVLVADGTAHNQIVRGRSALHKN